MAFFIDRRLDGKKKSAVNRQRFLRRYKAQIKHAVDKAMSGRSITDMASGERIDLPAQDISEPVFHHGNGGRRDMVHPGNREFTTGDLIPRPPAGGSGGTGDGEASDQGEGEDAFSFQLSREEFLELLFDDLELPDLVKRQLTRATEWKSVRAGYTSDGVPCNINVVRSLRGALARRMALSGPHLTRLRELENELEARAESETESPKDTAALREEIDRLKGRIARIPFIDTFDLRYNNRTLQPQPTSQAVMFCIMDVSGSMDQERKDLAKRFFTLLYLFLERNYERIDVVFVRHHTVAKEVDEEEFFYSRETGGTVVSSALRLTDEIMRERYPPDAWNIYAAQASDGDNWHQDSDNCGQLLRERLLPSTQYYAYVEIRPNRHQSLWEEYETLANERQNFAMRQIDGPADIYPVFRDLFKRRDAA